MNAPRKSTADTNTRKTPYEQFMHDHQEHVIDYDESKRICHQSTAPIRSAMSSVPADAYERIFGVKPLNIMSPAPVTVIHPDVSTTTSQPNGGKG